MRRSAASNQAGLRLPKPSLQGKPASLAPRGIERRHVRVEAGDQQHHRKALAGTVGGEPLESLGPVQTPHQPHPPGVGQPEERRPVGVLQVPGARCHAAQRSVPEERVAVIGAGLDIDDAGAAVQRRVGGVRTAGDEPMPADRRRGIAHAPPALASLECRHGQLLAGRIGDQNVQLDRGATGVPAVRGVLPGAYPVLRGTERTVHVRRSRGHRRVPHRPGAHRPGAGRQARRSSRAGGRSPPRG